MGNPSVEGDVAGDHFASSSGGLFMYKGEQCVEEQHLASLVWAFAWGEGPRRSHLDPGQGCSYGWYCFEQHPIRTHPSPCVLWDTDLP